MSFLKKVFFWNYARNTWQWDVLCVVILVFIFLSPKSWFATSERAESQQHQRPTSTVFIGAEVVEKEGDRTEIEHRVRSLTGRPAAAVIGVRPVTDQQGKVKGYEVDIR